MAKWRLSFDVPVDYAIEPGYRRAVHCADFTGGDQDASVRNVYREPVTGLLMLKPSHLSRDFYLDFKDINNFDKNADFWRPANRAVDSAGNGAPLLTSIQPQGSSPTSLEILVAVAPVAINASDKDDLKWALISDFVIGADEALCMHYHGLADEMLRFENWFTIHWDCISINISQTGICRVYQYPNRSDLTLTPTLLESFVFASPGDLVGSHGYFYLQPIPGYGLLFTHSRRTPRVDVLSSNANTGAAHGHLIKWPTHSYTPSGGAARQVCFEPSKVVIGVNPYMPHLLGYQSITFPVSPATGTFTDGVFDPIYKPSGGAAVVTSAFVAKDAGGSDLGTAAGTLQKPDNSGAWVAGTDRTGRVQMMLTSTDSRYTPFVTGYSVAWAPVTTTRSTAGVPPDKLMRLEFTEDEYARWDGTADVLMRTAAQRAIVERGDTTFLLEKSLDGNATWRTVNGGLAKLTDARMMVDNAGAYYLAKATLGDNWTRLDEIHDMLDTAFDGQPLTSAFDEVLLSAGFSGLTSYPDDLTAPRTICGTTYPGGITLPKVAAGQSWQISPREGEGGEQILQTFLIFLRRQNVEYRLRYDWDTSGWLIEYKPPCTGDSTGLATILGGDGGKIGLKPADDTTIWTLTAFSDEHDPATKSVRFEALTISPEPPEANVTTVIGVTSNMPGAQRVQSAPLTNQASMTDPASPDYLGRVKPFAYKVIGLQDQCWINMTNRTVFDAVAHWRLKGKIEAQDYVDDLGPNTYAHVRALDAGTPAVGDTPAVPPAPATLFDLWVKRRTVVVENEDQETVTYDLDSVWEGELQQ